MQQPAFLPCLLVAVIVGPLGCASQQSPMRNLGISDELPPLDVSAALAAVPEADAALPQAALAAATVGDPWPRQLTLADATALVYLPQVDRWEGNTLTFRAAVAVKQNGSNEETFGVIWGSARTGVDRLTRTVKLDQLTLTKARFPTVADDGLSYLGQLRARLPTAMTTMSMDLLQGELAAAATVRAKTVQVNNDPPRVIVSETPAILVPIDGNPSIRAIPNTRFERVINTQALFARSRGETIWYLHVFDGWLSATSLDGPWLAAASVPPGLNRLARDLAKQGSVDLLDGGPQAKPKPSLQNGQPTIYVIQVPAELIVFKGQPSFIPISGTSLLWAENTTADVLVNTANNDYYTLLSGRWYRAPGLGGPWTFVASTALPADFSRIPKEAPAGVVLASVAGTAQAQEALIANTIPQTAAVPLRNGPRFAPVFDGAPQLRAVDGTSLQYVSNASVPIIQVTPNAYYAVQAGVWFTAQALTGPWLVATSVPEVIYGIPVSSPLHYVTYVQVYGAGSEVVYVGYTPGYLGTVVASDGVVVYGTGYNYTPWIGSVWYAAPYTWGLAAAPIYNPYMGFGFGFGLGLATAAWTVPHWGGAYYHPGYWGYPCCGSASANVYGHWGNAVYAGTRSWYASADGRIGTTAAGGYTNLRTGTTGAYAAGRRYNPTPDKRSAATIGPSILPAALPATLLAPLRTIPSLGSVPTHQVHRRLALAAAQCQRRQRRPPAPKALARSTRSPPTMPRRGKRRAIPRVGFTATTMPALMGTFTAAPMAAGSSTLRKDGSQRRATPLGPTASNRRAVATRAAPAVGTAETASVAAATGEAALAAAAASRVVSVVAASAAASAVAGASQKSASLRPLAHDQRLRSVAKRARPQ